MSTQEKIQQLQKAQQIENTIKELTGFSGRLYIADDLSVVSPKNCTLETLHTFLNAFPPVPAFFYKDGCAGISPMPKTKRPETIHNECLSGIYINCQNEKYLPAEPKIKWYSLVDGQIVNFWAEMAPRTIPGRRLPIKVEPSEYERGLYAGKRMPELTAPIFVPDAQLKKVSFYGGSACYFASTKSELTELKTLLNLP